MEWGWGWGGGGWGGGGGLLLTNAAVLAISALARGMHRSPPAPGPRHPSRRCDASCARISQVPRFPTLPPAASQPGVPGHVLTAAWGTTGCLKACCA